MRAVEVVVDGLERTDEERYWRCRRRSRMIVALNRRMYTNRSRTPLVG